MGQMCSGGEDYQRCHLSLPFPPPPNQASGVPFGQICFASQVNSDVYLCTFRFVLCTRTSSVSLPLALSFFYLLRSCALIFSPSLFLFINKFALWMIGNLLFNKSEYASLNVHPGLFTYYNNGFLINECDIKH